MNALVRMSDHDGKSSLRSVDGGGCEAPSDPPLIRTRAAAEALLKGGLGRVQLEMVTSFCAPLFWVTRRTNDFVNARNGTATFVDTGTNVFAITAAHVVEGWMESRETEDAGPMRLAGNMQSIPFEWTDRAIDIDRVIDLATFRVEREEIRSLGKSVLTGSQRAWPPDPPALGSEVLYCGYPGVGTRIQSPREVVFGAVPGSGIAATVGDDVVTTMLERENLVPVLGGGIPPENFDFGGMSGGPMLMVRRGLLVVVSLAGIIHQGPNTSTIPGEAIPGFELLRAKRADFLLSDGRLDRERAHLGWRP